MTACVNLHHQGTHALMLPYCICTSSVWLLVPLSLVQYSGMMVNDGKAPEPYGFYRSPPLNNVGMVSA